MAAGIKRLGAEPVLYSVADWPQLEPQADQLPDVAVFYGLEGHLPGIFKYFRDFRRAAVYIDLGYWGRREGGRWAGYHKIVINARHPNAYFMTPQRPADRFEHFGIRIRDRDEFGSFILLGGMGDKGAAAEGFAPEEWERGMIQRFCAQGRPVVYRPKPSWKAAQPINGAGYSAPDTVVDWRRVGACVTHHSNLSVDALIEGVPNYCCGGAARALSIHAEIDNVVWLEPSIVSPPSPETRQLWAQNLAYTQWNIDEMRRGIPWAFLLMEGLI